MTGRRQIPISSRSTITTRSRRGKRRRGRLSVAQVAGGALAALTAATAASYLGVAGTVIGAAVMSVATTVGTDIYAHCLRRTGNKVRQHTTTGWRKRWTRPGTAPAAPPPRPPRGRLGWLRLGAGAALVFTISFGGILIYQILAGQTVADQVNVKTGEKAEPSRRHGPKERRTEPVLRQPRPRPATPAPSGSRSPASSPTPPPTSTQVTATAAPSGTVSTTPPHSPTAEPAATPPTPALSGQPSLESAPPSPAPVSAPAARGHGNA
ncbi:hypothetical protein [Nonomuraea sp. NPDC049400]|uniref:hypothetical protein n=1 Tax=Nonomuraea sp. NPDC049400 TaxID=3364352 RepID=UPI0037B710D5